LPRKLCSVFRSDQDNFGIKRSGEKQKKIGDKKGIPDDGLREESLEEANDRRGKLGLEEAAAHHNGSAKSTHSESVKGNVRAATRALCTHQSAAHSVGFYPLW
jgi:hypothetical protein